jgi:predicted ATPase
MNKKILITGGPGTGKTELINELENQGFNCEKEISREITESEQKKGVDQFFLKDPIEFSKRLMFLRTNQYNKYKMLIILFLTEEYMK